MSKKKGKVAARKAPMKSVKKAVKSAVKKAASKLRATRARLSATAAERGRTLHMSIFIFKTERGVAIRTTPQRLYANPGDFVAWNVINMVDGDNDVPVTISWPEPGPWGKDPIEIRNWMRKPFGDAPAGSFKFVVSAMGVEEDPEIEMPDGN